MKYFQSVRITSLVGAFGFSWLIIFVTPVAAGPLDTPDIAGQWGPLQNNDVVAVHLSLLPNGKAISWEEGGYNRPLTDEIRLWDPETGVLSSPTLPPVDIFCSGHSLLPDGKLFVQGGHDQADAVGQSKAITYDAATNSWQDDIPPMNKGRWYSTNTILPSGDVLVLGGAVDSYANKNNLPQIWELQTKTWRNLVAAENAAPIGQDFYPRMFVAPDGRIFKAGPDQDTWFLNTTGTGQWTQGPFMNRNGLRTYSASVMYDEGKIMIAGGGDPATNSVEVIDLNQPIPKWRTVAPMNFARRHLNTTILADGQILVTSGTPSPGFNNIINAVTIGEIWNPQTETWTQVAAQNKARAYHSNAILLPDGRVMVAGGGRPAPEGGTDNRDFEIYSPPYLFKGPRPQIITAPRTLSFGTSFDVTLANPQAITAVHMIRLGASTHSFNQTQSINKLTWTVTDQGLRVNAPTDPNRAQPGQYMLFVLANGVPSIAKMITFGDAIAPTAPTNLTASSIGVASVNLSWSPSTDNIKVTSYNVYRNGVLLKNVVGTATSVTGLFSGAEYEFTIAARDLFGNLSVLSAPLAVKTNSAGQNPPVAVAGVDQLKLPTQNFTLDGSLSSDIDNQLLTYEWSLDGQVVSTTPIFQASQPLAGVYLYKLTVSDGDFSSVDSIAVTVATQTNLLLNGDFPVSLANWTVEIGNGGAGQFNVEAGRARATVTAAGAQVWSLQLFQKLSLVAGQTYSLNFDAMSDATPRNFRVIVEEDGVWTGYAAQTFTINALPNTPQRFNLTWKQPTTSANVKLGFHLGANGLSDVWLDNITLVGGAATNLPPVAIAGKTINGFRGVAVNLDASGSYDQGANPTPLTYQWQQISGPVVTLNQPLTAKPAFTPTALGEYQFSVKVNDGTLDSNTDRVIVRVVDFVNQPPVANAGVDQMQVMGSLVTLNASASNDPDAAPAALTYSWRQLTGPVITLSNSKAVNPSFTAVQAGSYLFELVVNDGAASSATSQVVVSIYEPGLGGNLLTNGDMGNGLTNWLTAVIDTANATFVNEAGQAKINVNAAGGQTYSIQLYQVQPLTAGKIYTLAFDAATDALPRNVRIVIELNGAPWTGYAQQNFAIAQANKTQRFTLQWTQPVNVAQAKIGFHFGNAGVNDVWLDNVTLSDGMGGGNLAPVANAGTDQAVMTGTAVTLSGALSIDPDTVPSPLTYIWLQTSGPVTALTSTTNISPGFTPTAAGTYTFQLIVNDGLINSKADTVSIKVTNPNRPPIAAAVVNQTINLGDTAILDGSASSDPDNGPLPLVYAWTQLSGAQVAINPSAAKTTFVPPSEGEYLFSFVTDDGKDSSDFILVSVNVADDGLNKKPIANAGTDKVAAAGTLISLDGSASRDPDTAPATLTYQWTQTSGHPVTLLAPLSAFPQFTPAEPGLYEFSLVVSDGQDSAPADSVVVTVPDATNLAPIAKAGPAQTVSLGNLVNLDGSASFDPDSARSNLTYAWRQVEGPGINLNGPTSVTPSFTPNVPGRYSFELVVNDGQRSSTDSSLDPAKSLFVTDKAILRLFPMTRVLQKILDDSQDRSQTPAGLITQMANVRKGCADFNGFSQADEPNISALCSETGADMDLFNANINAGLTYYQPIALVNRIDLADANGTNCGEYRVIYAGNNIVEPRVNFFIFEAALPNPTPALGAAGCKGVASFWSDLSNTTSVASRADALEKFYFTGINGFAPAIRASHFRGEANQSGSIRLNARVDQLSNWVFMQFRAITTTACAPNCNLSIEQESLANTPFPNLAGDPQTHALAPAFQQAVIAAMQTKGEKLLANSISQLRIDLPKNLSLGRQHSGLLLNQSLVDAMSPQFTQAIQQQLTAVGSTLTPTNIITRVNQLTCAGCHNQSSPNLGAPLVFNSANQFVEFTSMIDEEGPNGKRYTVKPAMKNTLLPERKNLLLNRIDESRVTITVNQAIIDTDKDGVPDERDACLDTPANTAVDVRGCILIQSALVQAENYNLAQDTSIGNFGAPTQCAYKGLNVDIENTTDAGGGCNLGWTEVSEWLEYPLTLSDGTYAVTARVASQPGSQYSLAMDGVFIGTDLLGPTGGWQMWQTRNMGNVTVAAGAHKLRVNLAAAGLNINWIQFTATNLVLDTDQDGVVDPDDKCQGTAKNTAVDSKGCALTGS